MTDTSGSYFSRLPATAVSSLLSPDLEEQVVALTSTTDDILTQILAWLTDLSTFSKVPFYYLVPHPLLLPAESLRMFNVDPYWIQALVDGALSIGSYLPIDRQIRDQIKVALANYTNPGGKVAPVAGFFMRSGLVTSFASIAPKIGDGSGHIADDQSAIIKVQTLSPDLSVCWLANNSDGTAVKEIIWAEPQEHLRMGFYGTNFSDILIKTRKTDGSVNGDDQIVHSDIVSVIDSNTQIIDISIKDLIATHLSLTITPSTFAIQMFPPSTAYSVKLSYST